MSYKIEITVTKDGEMFDPKFLLPQENDDPDTAEQRRALQAELLVAGVNGICKATYAMSHDVAQAAVECACRAVTARMEEKKSKIIKVVGAEADAVNQALNKEKQQ